MAAWWRCEFQKSYGEALAAVLGLPKKDYDDLKKRCEQLLSGALKPETLGDDCVLEWEKEKDKVGNAFSEIPKTNRKWRLGLNTMSLKDLDTLLYNAELEFNHTFSTFHGGKPTGNEIVNFLLTQLGPQRKLNKFLKGYGVPNYADKNRWPIF